MSGRAALTANPQCEARMSPHEPAPQLQQRAADRQADPRRPHRRRQVRLDVPRADPAHAGRSPGRHRRPRRPTARAPTSPASAGAPSRRAPRRLDDARQDGHDAHRRGLAGAGVATRRSTSSSNAPAIRSPRSSIAWRPSRTASTSSTSRSRPMRSAARCWRASAAEAGVVYSLAFGDQPALICDLVDWARTCGFPVVAAGRGHKWLPHFSESTPETVWGNYGLTPEQADARRPQPEDVQQLPRRLQALDRIAPRWPTRPA